MSVAYLISKLNKGSTCSKDFNEASYRLSKLKEINYLIYKNVGFFLLGLLTSNDTLNTI